MQISGAGYGPAFLRAFSFVRHFQPGRTEYHLLGERPGGVFVPDLLAYIDPGSGSLIIQVAIATLVAIPIFFRTQIARIVNRVRGRTEAQAPADDRADGD